MTPVHHYLRARAATHPERLALVGRDALTYQALWAGARAVAAELTAWGLAPGERVALWLPKSSSAVTALYGALAAGTIYVPLDPLQPPARAAAILADSEPAVLVTDRAHLERLVGPGAPAGALPASIRLVLIADGVEGAPPVPGVASKTLAAVLDGPQLGDEVRSPGPDDLAILLYTSGSTGVPKGVKISFGNLHTFVSWCLSEMALGPDDVFSSHAGFHFDLSTFDLFAAAGAGAAVWLVPEDDARDPHALARGMRSSGVSVWYSVPSILTLMLGAEALDTEAAARLRYVLFAGEVFPVKHLRALRERLPGARLYNLYGPTETNVCTYHEVRELAPERTTPVPIGRPLPGQDVWLAGPDGERLDGAGAVGELIVRGSSVTPGYWRRAGDALAEQHARHTHPTGDLVSWEGDALVYRGRRDRMVKVSGFRVELGEIEAALLRHPGVAEVAVLAVGTAEALRLLAYYVSAPGAAPLSVLEAKAHSSRFLPRYMIPHGVERLEALPKNANGKVDFRALAERSKA